MLNSTCSAVVTGLLPQRACQNCVKVKVKCVPQEGTDGAICQRCVRLRRTCFTSTPTVRKRRRNNESKVAQLESRINELSSLVGSTNAIPTNNIHDLPSNQLYQNTPTPQPNSGQGERRYTYFTPHTLGQDSCTSADIATRSKSTHGVTSHSLTDDEPSALLVQEDNPDVFQEYPTSDERMSSSQVDDPYTLRHLLSSTSSSSNPFPLKSTVFCPIFLDPKLECTLFKDYCKTMSPYFPFLVLDASMPMEIMKKKRPFLFWACITAASFHQHQLHGRLVNEMLKGISEHAFAKNTKNLDLLQAVLVMIAWYHFYAHLAPQLANLLHLANAMIVDLGINRPPRSISGRFRIITESADSCHNEQEVTNARTSDERRALLGCFFLLSKSSMCCITNLEPMRYTKYMHECCRFLENLAESETDAHLVQLVELHRITGKYLLDEITTSNMPIRLYSTVITEELQRFRERLPVRLESSPLFRAEIGFCKVYLYGPSRFAQCDDSMERIQSLHLCVTGLTECLADLEEVTIQEFCCATFSTWICAMECLIMNARLSFLKVDGWDLDYVRSKLNFASLVQTIIDRFETIRKYNSMTKPETAAWKFSLYAERLRKCKHWYEAKIALEKGSATSYSQTSSSEGLDGTFDPPSFQFDSNFDDMIWGDIIGSWTYF